MSAGVDRAIIRDRQKLAGDGFLLVAVPIDGETGELSGEIEVAARGFAEIHAANSLKAGASKVARDVLQKSKANSKRPGDLGETSAAGAAGGLGLPSTRDATTSYGGSGGGTGLIGSIRPVLGRLR